MWIARLGFLACTALLFAQVKVPPPVPEVGALLDRIDCPEGFEARIFATGLASPDGLAFDAKGRVCVVEESAGRVTRIGPAGEHETVAQGLNSPEGICLGPRGEFYVVEDCANGRLLEIGTDGEVATIAEGLDAPEGVAIRGDSLFLTESSVQFERNPLKMRTRVLELRRAEGSWGAPTVLLERPMPFSFAELLEDGPVHLLVANELAGGKTKQGLWRLDLETGEFALFGSGLVTPEGLCWTPGEEPGFPLYVAEENPDNEGNGRISRVSADGVRSTHATGFKNVEDVLVGPGGRVYVSEDSSGMIIVLCPVPAERADVTPEPR